jgi:type I restriction enzyme S subunit
MKQGNALSLPKGWEIKKLSQLFDVKSSRRVHQADWKSSGIPFYRAREVVKLSKDGMVENELFISQELYDEFTKGKGAPKTDDIIVSAVGTLGQCYLVKDSDKFYFKDASVLWFENMGKVNSRYIEYAFKADSIMAQVMNGSMGATVGTLTISRAKDIEIPIPPLTEQKRIVAILDEAFAAIAKALANAEQNLKNSKELFGSYLQRVFEPSTRSGQGNKGEGWEEQLLGNCFKLKSGDNLTSKNMTEGEYPVFGGNGIAGYHNDYNLLGSNVIVGRVGALCGNVRLITENIWLTDNAFKVVDFKFEFDHSFLTYLLNYKNLRGFARQAAQPVISNSSLKDVVLEFPKSLKQQQTIVQKLDALSLETKRLEANYQQKINDLEELKKSVLQKAFAGELGGGESVEPKTEKK